MAGKLYTFKIIHVNRILYILHPAISYKCASIRSLADSFHSLNVVSNTGSFNISQYILCTPLLETSYKRKNIFASLTFSGNSMSKRRLK